VRHDPPTPSPVAALRRWCPRFAARCPTPQKKFKSFDRVVGNGTGCRISRLFFFAGFFFDPPHRTVLCIESIVVFIFTSLGSAKAAAGESLRTSVSHSPHAPTFAVFKFDMVVGNGSGCRILRLFFLAGFFLDPPRRVVHRDHRRLHFYLAWIRKSGSGGIIKDLFLSFTTCRLSLSSKLTWSSATAQAAAFCGSSSSLDSSLTRHAVSCIESIVVFIFTSLGSAKAAAGESLKTSSSHSPHADLRCLQI